MKVRMITLAAGPDGTRLPGKTYPVSAEEGKALVDGGYAVEVKSTDATASSSPRTGDKPQGRRAAKKDAVDEPTEGKEASEEEEPTE